MFEDLTRQDIIILIGLVSLIIIMSIICIIMSLASKKKKKKIVKEDVTKEPDINMALATDKIPTISDKAPEMEDMYQEEKEQEETIEKEEKIEELDMGVEEMQDMKNRTSIESVLEAMNADLEKQKYEKIDKYEEEQEENAVISYQELLDRKLISNDEPQVKETVEVLEKTSYDDNKPVDYKKIEVSRTDKTGKFSSSEFISPIFGRQENTMEYPTVKKVTETTTYTHPQAKEEDLKEESDDFLDSLKKFRSNL